MKQLQHISANHLSFECPCGHSPLIPVTEMIKRYGGETTVDHVRAKARCSSCGQKTFQFRIVYCGGSYDALIGAANTKMDGTVQRCVVPDEAFLLYYAIFVITFAALIYVGENYLRVTA